MSARSRCRAALDRLGVCNRLNLALVDRGPRRCFRICSRSSARRASRCADPAAIEAAGERGAARRPRAPRVRVGERARRVATVTLDWSTTWTRRCGSRTRRRRGSRPGIVTEDERGREPLPRRLPEARPRSGTRRRASPTASSSPEHPRRGSTSTPSWAARPGDVPRSLAAPVPSSRRRHADPLTQPVVVKFGTGLVVGEDGEVRTDLLHARASEIAEIVGRQGSSVRRLVRSDRTRAAEAGLKLRP